MKNLEIKAKNYNPGSISFADGFMGCGFRGGDVQMYADYKKAKNIVKQLIAEGRNIESVEMGLDGDWQCNSMTIWEDGKFDKYDCWGDSNWAEPIIIVNFTDAPSETYAVWKNKE